VRKGASNPRGFTLLEILVATGFFALAVTGLIALFPLVQRVSREGEEEARGTMIAENILSVLALPSASGSFRLATGIRDGDPLYEQIDPTASSEHCVAYGSACEPLFPLDGGKAGLPVTTPGALDVATVRLTAKPSLPGLVVAEVDVASPASAPASGRSTHRFLRLYPVPSRHE
jgi:type II secretory pathway pseudopilin PulG